MGYWTILPENKISQVILGYPPKTRKSFKVFGIIQRQTLFVLFCFSRELLQLILMEQSESSLVRQGDPDSPPKQRLRPSQTQVETIYVNLGALALVRGDSCSSQVLSS